MFTDFVTIAEAADENEEMLALKRTPDFPTAEEEIDAVNRIPDIIADVERAFDRAYAALERDNFDREAFLAFNQSRSWLDRFKDEASFRDIEEPRHLRRFGFDEAARTIAMVHAAVGEG